MYVLWLRKNNALLLTKFNDVFLLRLYKCTSPRESCSGLFVVMQIFTMQALAENWRFSWSQCYDRFFFFPNSRNLSHIRRFLSNFLARLFLKWHVSNIGPWPQQDYHNHNEGRSSSVPPSLLQQQQQQYPNGQTRIGSPVAFRGGRPPPPNVRGPWPQRSLSPRYYRPPPGKFNVTVCMTLGMQGCQIVFGTTNQIRDKCTK
jgi:hypothetical protein